MIKTATIYRIADVATRTALNRTCLPYSIDTPTAGDPDKTAWARAGFSQPEHFTDGPVFVSQSGMRVLNMQLRERILPGKVIKTKLAERIADIAERQGKKPNRKEIASMKDELVAELLPTAFIKPTDVTIVIKDTYVIIGTGSARLVDLVFILLRQALPDHELKFESIAKGREPVRWMTDLLLAGTTTTDGGEFDLGTSVVLRGPEKATARFKDMDLHREDISNRVTEGFKPVEIAVEFGEDVGFTLTEQMIIKRFVIANILLREVDNEVGDDNSAVTRYDATMTLVIGELLKVVTGLLREVQVTAVNEDEEDEL